MSRLFNWIDKMFVTVYLTNGSNYCVFELIRFVLLQLYFLSCLVRAELDLFDRVRPLFRLDYLVGWVSLQVWLFTPIILTIMHGRMNPRVIVLIRDMKGLLCMESDVPENLLRSFAWKLLTIQIILTILLMSSTAYHMLIIWFEWSIVDISCLVPCAWFVHVPLLHLVVWMCLLKLLHKQSTLSLLRMFERLENMTSSSQLLEFKKLIKIMNTLLAFRGRVATTYENTLMLYLLCCLGCIIYLCYNSIIPGGEVYVSKAIQWLICLFLTYLVPALVMDEVLGFVAKLTRISEMEPSLRIHAKVQHFLTRMLHEDRIFQLHGFCHLSLHTFLRILSGALAYVVIQYQLRPED